MNFVFWNVIVSAEFQDAKSLQSDGQEHLYDIQAVPKEKAVGLKRYSLMMS